MPPESFPWLKGTQSAGWPYAADGGLGTACLNMWQCTPCFCVNALQVIHNQFLQVLNKLLLYYPSRLAGTLIINSPSWFNMAWKVVSPHMTERARMRTKVLFSDQEVVAELGQAMPKVSLCRVTNGVYTPGSAGVLV